MWKAIGINIAIFLIYFAIADMSGPKPLGVFIGLFLSYIHAFISLLVGTVTWFFSKNHKSFGIGLMISGLIIGATGYFISDLVSESVFEH